MTSRPVRPPARPPLRRMVLRLGVTALAAATLVWSGLFYSAVAHHNAATAVAPATSGSGASQSSQAPAPVVTRAS
jgi:hypothetical protein